MRRLLQSTPLFPPAQVQHLEHEGAKLVVHTEDERWVLDFNAVGKTAEDLKTALADFLGKPLTQRTEFASFELLKRPGFRMPERPWGGPGWGTKLPPDIRLPDLAPIGSPSPTGTKPRVQISGKMGCQVVLGIVVVVGVIGAIFCDKKKGESGGGTSKEEPRAGAAPEAKPGEKAPSQDEGLAIQSAVCRFFVEANLSVGRHVDCVPTDDNVVMVGFTKLPAAARKPAALQEYETCTTDAKARAQYREFHIKQILFVYGLGADERFRCDLQPTAVDTAPEGAQDGDTCLGLGQGGRATLNDAVATGDIEGVRCLIRAGADVNSAGTGWHGDTPLHVAVDYCDRPEIVRVLLEAGANVNAKRDGGDAPLHEAAGSGCLTIVKMLVAADASINARNDMDETPLYFATPYIPPSQRNQPRTLDWNPEATAEFLRSKGAVEEL